MTTSFVVLAPLLLERDPVFGWALFGSISSVDYLAIGSLVLALSVLEGCISIMRIPFLCGPLRTMSMLGLLAFLLSGGKAKLWPGLLLMLGIGLTGMLLAYLTASLITIAVALTMPLRHEEKGQLALSPLASFCTMMPAVTYAAWLRWANGF